MRHLRLVLETIKEPLGPAEIAKVREAYSLAVSGLGLEQEQAKLALASFVLQHARINADATADEIAQLAANRFSASSSHLLASQKINSSREGIG
jgi:hypothetical protein